MSCLKSTLEQNISVHAHTHKLICNEPVQELRQDQSYGTGMQSQDKL